MNFTTERLTNRSFEEGNLAVLFEIHSNEEKVKYLLNDPWTEENKVEQFKKGTDNKVFARDSPVNQAVVIDDKVIGDLFVIYTSMQETVEISYTFSKDFGGEGYAQEAVHGLIATLFDQYQIHRIVANLNARNTSSAALCERLGMRKEAHFIRDYWSKGEWTDSLIYAMLASKFDTNI